jgi:hypothetical protein
MLQGRKYQQCSVVPVMRLAFVSAMSEHQGQCGVQNSKERV